MYKKKNNSRKAGLVLLAVVLVIGCAVGGTLAWLTDETAPVVNTFTSSDVSITLTETKPDSRTAKMVPGADIAKDPTVTVSADSEDCYVFVKVEKSVNFDTYMTYTEADGWAVIESGDNYVVYGRTAKANNSFSVLKDDKVAVRPDVTKANMAQIDGKGGTDAQNEAEIAARPKLTFTAYAIQSANLADRNSDSIVDAKDAWALIGK